jgi:streptogramin lyase
VPIPATHGISGSVYGGQQPVSGATIQLYAVGSGLKAASTALISATVTTSPTGTFNITSDYSCTGNPLVYIVATGGSAGSGTNSSLALMAALGPCSSLTSSTFISINELTTVASVYALAPYMSGYKNVGAASTDTAGLTNAFNTVNSLVNIATGTAPGLGLPATGAVPTTELNTLANILASCVNSSGPGTGTLCTNLITAATPTGGTAPSDTVGVALNIATHPGSNVSALFNFAAAQPPFGPALTTSPNDWTVAIKYTDPSITSPYGLAIDASGNVWVTNETGASVTKLSGIGAVLSGSGYTGGGLLGPKGIAIDRTGNVWIANTGGNSVVELGPTGSVLSGSGFTSGGIDAPVAIAVDSKANVYVANFSSNSVTVLTSTGSPFAASPLTDSGAIASPNGIAVDKSGYVWVSNSGANNLIFIQPSSGNFYYSLYTDNAIQGSSGIAVDTNSNKWVAATGINAISLFSGFAGANALSPIRAAGLSLPTGVATDGSNNIWITNGSPTGSLSELSSTGTLLSPTTGLGSLNTPVSIGVDPSGSIWTANLGDNSVTEFVGVATPATTPLAAVAGP